ncbi:glycosyltransferase 87 family protein [Rugosimonospora acidiphila]|uniref:glycosyltransferase 87 family protein n=1 Tax=Rugosimonospora acidiphila TaxID=556531 RepID=UPI0031ECE543
MELAYLLIGCSVLFVAAWRRGWTVPLWAALLIALGARAVVAVLASGYTPQDVAECFRDAGNLVLAGRDPMTQLPRYEWNFLPVMPYVFAGEVRSGLPWPLAAKVAPIAADLVTTALLSRFRPAPTAGGGGWSRSAQRGGGGWPRFPRTPGAPGAPLLYALCPLAILISAVHGQVEPVALAMGTWALLLARRGAAGRTGLLAGLAIATKTWPVLLVLGMLRDTPVSRWWRLLASLAVAPLAALLTVRLFLHDSMRAALGVLVSYRSMFGWWGWSGMLHLLGLAGTGYTGPGVAEFQRVGTVIVIAAMGAVLLARWADGVALTAAVLLAFLAVTAGFGPQYLVWPVPCLILLRWSWGLAFTVLAGCYGMFVYLVAIPYPGLTWAGDVERWACLPVIMAAVLAVRDGVRAIPATARHARVGRAGRPGWRSPLPVPASPARTAPRHGRV